MESDVLFKEIPGNDGVLGIITLNRPAVLNSLNHNIIKAMLQQLTAWAAASSIKAVVITGASERAFCAGGDLRFTYELHQHKSDKITAFFQDEYRLNSLIFHYPKPYIAFLNGITMGGGVGVSIHGSHRIATERLSFAMPETGIGLFPDVGGTYFLPRLPHHFGFYLGLTGIRINADDCIALKIAQHKLSAASFDDLINTLAATSLRDNAHAAVTEVINSFAIPTTASTLMEQAAIIESYFSERTMESIFTKLATASHPLMQAAFDALQKKSPTSLKVTLLALLKGAVLSFDACMEQEYRLMTNFLSHHDFFEGIRAVIIDKDQQPKWCPSRLEEISNDTVNSYFQSITTSSFEQ
jgi:enoyl-CoA hydratase/carnithine racemase